MKIILSLLIFGIIVCFHEFGHFVVAKKCDVKVNKFMIGFGPKLYAFTKGETEYSIRLLPLGGACVMEGEDEASEDSRSFAKKPLWQRFLIVFAGPLFNFIMAFVVACFVLLAAGFHTTEIDHVMKDSPAEQSGLQAGDELISANAHPLHFYKDLSIYVFFNQQRDIVLRYKRNGEIKESLIRPQYDEESGQYVLGIYGKEETKKPNIIQIIPYAFYELESQTYTVWQSLKMLVQRKISLKEMSGPIGIIKTISDSYDQSIQVSVGTMLITMLNIVILLSVNLGVMNLLPIPALDGGRIAIFVAEGISGKKIKSETEALINLAGFAALMILIFIVMKNDISKIIG